MKRGIRLVDSNKEKIEDTLNEANGRAKLRTIDSYSELADIVNDCREHLLKRVDGSRVALDGIVVRYACKYKLPRAYKYSADTTYVQFRFGKNGTVTVLSAYRSIMDRVDNGDYECDLTDYYVQRMVDVAKRFSI